MAGFAISPYSRFFAARIVRNLLGTKKVVSVDNKAVLTWMV